MRVVGYIAILALCIAIAACELDINNVTIAELKDSELSGAKEPTEFIKSGTEGLYFSELKGNPFGDTLVFKWSKKHLSVFTGKNTSYFVLESGYKSGEIIFEGYWRQANSDQMGIVRLKVTSDNGAKDLIGGTIPAKIIITGTFSGGEGGNPKEIQFTRIGPLKPSKMNFWIIAHKGGGRNIDRLPHAENSIELIEYAERLGANSIEIDVQLTKDNVPVLFHDEYLSKRTINEDYFIGKVSDYTYKQLNNFVTLKTYNGTGIEERIPSLEDALDAVVKNTNLRLVWLDIKNSDVIPYLVDLQRKYLDLAAKSGRDLEILIGIPDEDVFNSIKSQVDYRNIPTLCELDENYVTDANSMIWAPRWSMGLINDRVKKIHDGGKRAFVWTLDDPILINTYLEEGDFDGIVTNYSPVVAYDYYTGK